MTTFTQRIRRAAGRVGALAGLTLMLAASSASAETLMMPNRDATMNAPVVVWGISNLGGNYVINFGDGSSTASTPISDGSYIALAHTYTTPGVKHATLTVGAETASVDITVFDTTPAGGLTASEIRALGINSTIQDGLRYLWTAQNNRVGYATQSQTAWDGNPAFTAMVVLAFENHGFTLLDDQSIPTDIYRKYVVLRGLNFVFATLSAYPLDPQVGGDPCIGGNLGVNCLGLRSYVYGNDGYATGAVTIAIAGSHSLNRLVTSGAGSASGFPNYNGYLGYGGVDYLVGKTYGEVLQRMIDTVAWGQGDSGSGRASWSYSLQSGGDGSTVGWNVLAMLDVAAAGLTVPAWSVADFKNFALVAHSNKCAGDPALDGSFDYTADNNPCFSNHAAGPNVGKTGIGLQGQFLAGTLANDVRVTDAATWISNRWDGANVYPFNFYGCGSPGSQNKGCAYMMFNAFKGLKLYGITALPGVNRPAGPGYGVNDWYADYVDYLVTTQTAPNTTGGGYWGSLGFSCCGGGAASAAALAELILSPVALVLPDSQKFATVGLGPLTALNPVGTTHTVTANTVSSGQNPLPVPGVTVSFNVTSGPSSGFPLVCSETGTNSNSTDQNGNAPCTYTGSHGIGVDNIRASINSQSGPILSNTVSKTWGDCTGIVATGPSMYPLDAGLRLYSLSSNTAVPISNYAITAVCQDENPNFENIPAYAQDGVIATPNSAQLRAQRSGTRTAPGNGRVYTIKFNSNVLACSSSVTVKVNTTPGGVPPAVNDGALWNSLTGANICP